MKKLPFAVIVLFVAILSYGLGRRHRLPSSAPAATNSVTLETPVTARAAPRLAAANPGNVSRVDLSAPFAQKMTTAQRGFEAARNDLQAALNQIDSLPVPERMGFITGIFSFVARHKTPAEGLKVYQQVPEGHRPNALRALVAEWIHARSPQDEDMRYLKREGTYTISGFNRGLETELTSMLASSQPDAELTAAWLDAFSNHTSRADIFSILGGRLAIENPDAMLARTANWTAWEKERTTKSFLANWSHGAPQDAWNWYQSRRDRFEQDYSASILAPWASNDPEGARRLLDSLEDPTQRKAAISAIGKVLAEKNTDQAVSWAEGLADAGERETAHRAVYEGAPRGIGAVLNFKDGFPQLRGIVPGSPLDGTGAKAGDQIVEVREASGTTHSLHGRDLQTAVNAIRGEPGTEMTLRVLRRGGTGELEEHLIPVTRGQLYLDEKLITKPPASR
jgi:hypothetical protein